MALDTSVISQDTNKGKALLDLETRISTLEGGDLPAGSISTAELEGGAATGAKISPTGFKSGSFAGVAAAGPATLTGAVVGDRVLAVSRIDAAANAVGQQASFESVITVVDQIQQTDAGDLSLQVFSVVLIPASA